MYTFIYIYVYVYGWVIGDGPATGTSAATAPPRFYISDIYGS